MVNQLKMAYILVFFGVIAYSIAPIFIRFALLEGMKAEWITALRLAIACVPLAPLVLIKRKKAVQIRHTGKKSLLLTVLSGFALAVHFATWTLSLSLTTALASTALICLQIIFSLILSRIFLKEMQTKFFFIALGMSVVGSMLIFWSDMSANGNLLGAVYAVISSVFISIYYLLGRVARKNMSTNTYTFIVYTTGAAALILYALCLNIPITGVSIKSLVSIVCLVVLSTYFGHSVINWALKYIDSVYVSFITLLQPAFTYVWFLLLFSEVPTITTIIGTLIIISGIAIYLPQKMKNKLPQ